jgi:hypothetical protein
MSMSFARRKRDVLALHCRYRCKRGVANGSLVRKSPTGRITGYSDMYGPPLGCKRKIEDDGYGLRQCIRPLVES